MNRPRTAPATVAIALVLLSGCGVNAVPQAELENGVGDKVTELVGTAPDAIECPGDLDAVVGTTMRCTFTDGEDELGVTVRVTQVDIGDVSYDVAVDVS
ncbi:DUF4333 domain-containing protein [Nocardioides sp. zg-1308]|uniref:DUF4333 domain-containing protein n=1 Tax=Nocardioides TaxID=1839 RepID=UPI0015572667|nr:MULTISPECIES: DUF4333 domain-containing protein [unclassified Nocardioides]NPD06066.1 DUF4333 domain-containing protein [Nocardioides sp. zg-1308]WQQ20401.1 DUF4333 domain-containing protein [Nocardioides sp. S-34]